MGIYNFAITITRIHLAICKVQSDNLNPEETILNLRRVKEYVHISNSISTDSVVWSAQNAHKVNNI